MIAKGSNEDLARGLPGTKDELVRQNIALVRTLAKRVVRPRTVDFEDLVQEGLVAVLLSVDKYDPGRGCKFMTYAGTAAFRRMVRYVCNNISVVHVPSATEATREKYRNARAKARWVGRVDNHRDWTDQPRCVDVESSERGQVIDDAKIDTAEILSICRILDMIDSRGEEVLRLRSSGMTLGDVGRRFGISRERVRQIESHTLEAIREVVAE